jgi:hypothetical protein
MAAYDTRVSSWRHVLFLAVSMVLVSAAVSLRAHDLERTQVSLSFGRDGSFVLDVANDPKWLLLRLEPFAGAPPPSAAMLESPTPWLSNLGAVFVDRIVLFVDGHEVRPASVEYIAPPSAAGDRTPLGVYRLRGRVSATANTLRWYYGLVIDPYPLTIRRADGAAATHWIGGDQWSAPLELAGQFLVPTRADVVRDYLALGYTHILPKGLDHILFVLGLFLLSTRLRPMLLQVTTFTVAHSITLGLTMYGVVSLSPRIVEPLIALSIAYVAVENLLTSTLTPWRLGLVFSFGLLHGMGFAGVLRDLGLPRGEFVTALLSFNVGVEAGQLTVIAAAGLAVAWYLHRDWYRRRIVVPASLAIACVGAYWTVARVM